MRIDRKFIKKWAGLGLIVFALLFIPVMALVPFTPLSIKQKAAAIAVLAIGGQILTWIGVFLAGKEIVARYKKQLNPRNWFRHK